MASFLYKNRIVYLGMCLVPSVTELMLAEFLYLQYEDAEKPIYMYINSTGTTKVGAAAPPMAIHDCCYTKSMAACACLQNLLLGLIMT